MIDRTSDRALYRQLADLIRGQIQSGQLQPGEELPPASALAARYGLGRDAVRDAIELLRSEGVVVTERGRPARVSDRPTPVVLRDGDRAEVRRGGTVVVTRADGKVETYRPALVKIVT